MDIKIRVVDVSDAKTVHDIYESYIDSEHVTFTIDDPGVAAYEQKIAKTLKKYPFYIAEDASGKVLGYIHGSPLRPHDAYKWDVESTVMLAKDAPRRAGIATALYAAFNAKLEEQGYKHVYAVIIDTNAASIKLHESLGFETVGHFSRAGYKLGKWMGIVWMQKDLGDPDAAPAEPKAFSDN